MDINTFWDIIQKTNTDSKSIKDFKDILIKKSADLSDEELLFFQMIYEYYEIKIILQRSHLMWSALAFINGGYCTDTYGFAGWLISKGRQAYYGVLKDADNLAKLEPKKDQCNYNLIRRLAQMLYMDRTGVKINKFKSIYKELWNSKESKDLQKAIDESLVIDNTKRDMKWTMKELENIFPALAVNKR